MLLFCLSPLLLPPFSGGLPYVASVHMYDQLLRGLFNDKNSSYNNNNKSHLLSTCWIFDIYWLMSSSQFRGVINGRTFSRSELMSSKAGIGMHLHSTPKPVLHFSLQQAASIRASGLSNSTSSRSQVEWSRRVVVCDFGDGVSLEGALLPHRAVRTFLPRVAQYADRPPSPLFLLGPFS